MRRYKKLQQYADESLSKLRADDFLEALKSRIPDKKQKRMDYKRLYNALGNIAVAIVTVILLCVFLINPAGDNEEIKNYLLINQKQQVSSITAINESTAHIDFLDAEGVVVSKTIDKIYKEVLYYTLKIKNNYTNESLTAIVAVNKNYSIDFDHYLYNREDLISNFTINYNEQYTTSGSEENCNAKGEINTGDEIIYISYEGAATDTESNFLSYLRYYII